MWVRTDNPLVTAEQDREAVKALLATAANMAGEGIILGQQIVLWGGRGPCVGLRLGDRVRLYDGCKLVIDHLCPESGITIGNDVAMNFNGYIDGSGGVTIGAGTMIGPNVVIVSSQHDMAFPLTAGAKILKPVRIGRDVWIGANAVIQAGVTIGDGCVIGAGTVVTKDMPTWMIVVGNPGYVVRPRPIDDGIAALTRKP